MKTVTLLLINLFSVSSATNWQICSHQFCNFRGICNRMASSLSPISYSSRELFLLSYPPGSYSDANRYCIRQGGNLISKHDEIGIKEAKGFLKGFEPAALQAHNILGVWLAKPNQGDCYIIDFKALKPFKVACDQSQYYVALCRLNTPPSRVMEGEPNLKNFSCQCEHGYGSRNCKPIGQESFENCFELSQSVSLGDESGSDIVIVDHAVFGRPIRLSGRPQGHCEENMYANYNDDVCITGNTFSLVKYWCQGKQSCSFPVKSLVPPSYDQGIFFPDEGSVSYYEAYKMCKQQQAVIFQPQNDYDLRRIGEYLLSQSDAYAAWIYPSEVVSQGDVLTDEAITCKAVISPKFAIDIRMDTSEEKGSLPQIISLPCREDNSLTKTIPVCQKVPFPYNPNVNYDCLNNLGPNKIFEYRYHMEPDLNKKDISCTSGTFYRRSNTCFKKTEKMDWNKARLQCWLWGGELAFPFSIGEQCSAPIIRDNTEELWIAGGHRHVPRPILALDSSHFEEGTYDRSNDLCFPDLGLDTWCSLIDKCKVERRGLCALPPTSKYIDPPIKPDPIKKCPKSQAIPEWPYEDYEWNELGTPGRITIQKCPHKQDGTVEWKCGKDGNWEGYPDFSQCRSFDFESALDSLENTTDVPPSEVLHNVYQQVYPSDNFATGDINYVMKVMEKALKKQQYQLSQGIVEDEEEYSKEYTDKSVKLIDTLLKKYKTWFGLPPKKTQLNLNRIMSNVETFAGMYMQHGSYIQSLFNYSNIVLNMKKIYDKEESYTFDGSSEIHIVPTGSQKLNVVFQAFPRFNCIFNKKIRCEDPDPVGKNLVTGPVIGATLFDSNRITQHMNVAVDLLFKNSLNSNIEASNAQCVFWDTTIWQWSSQGCELVEFTQEYTKCKCNHLTNFAVLMDFNNALEEYAESSQVLDYITLVGCSLSIFSLLICLFVFFVILRNTGERVIIHQNLCLCLFLGEIILLAGLDSAKEGKYVCTFIAASLHFLFLSSFFWMLLEGINIYLKLVKVFDSGLPRTYIYFITGYGIPATIVLLSVCGVNYVSIDGYTSEDFCWLNTKNGAIWLFNGPALVIILVNGCFFIMALKIARSSILRRNDRSNIKNSMLYFRGSTSLLCVLGLTWIFGFMFFSEGFVWVAYIFVILNSLQGVFILIFHVLLNEKARLDIRRFFRKNQFIRKWWLDQSVFSGQESTTKERSTGIKDLSSHEISSQSTKSSRF